MDYYMKVECAHCLASTVWSRPSPGGSTELSTAGSGNHFPKYGNVDSESASGFWCLWHSVWTPPWSKGGTEFIFQENSIYMSQQMPTSLEFLCMGWCIRILHCLICHAQSTSVCKTFQVCAIWASNDVLTSRRIWGICCCIWTYLHSRHRHVDCPTLA